jgi:hypothetical protein
VEGEDRFGQDGQDHQDRPSIPTILFILSKDAPGRPGAHPSREICPRQARGVPVTMIGETRGASGYCHWFAGGAPTDRMMADSLMYIQ